MTTKIQVNYLDPKTPEWLVATQPSLSTRRSSFFPSTDPCKFDS